MSVKDCGIARVARPRTATGEPQGPLAADRESAASYASAQGACFRPARLFVACDWLGLLITIRGGLENAAGPTKKFRRRSHRQTRACLSVPERRPSIRKHTCGPQMTTRIDEKATRRLRKNQPIDRGRTRPRQTTDFEKTKANSSCGGTDCASRD